MIRNKQKGQAIVEFALILPILLLLLLGIIEGGRIIWAYITVQNAAREAARYAVAGRPLSCRGDPNDPETAGILDGDPNNPDHFCDNSAIGGDPWSNDVLDIVRVEAIERQALHHGRNLTEDLLQASRVGVAGYNAGKTIPGQFGVLVVGQDGDHPEGAPNIPGKPGWNVRVQTYYNVKMLDPIYDTILGGQVVHLEGEVELQNEGIDAANQGNYSGSISYNESNCPPDCGSLVATPYIIVQDAFGDMAEDAGSTFTVYAEDHLPDTTYELCFEGVTSAFATDCISFHTNALGSAAVTYFIPVAAPRSDPTGTKTYRIFTRLPAGTDDVAACAPPATACFEITGVSARISASNIGEWEQQPPVRWPISSSIPIYIYGHDPNSSFPITFNGDLATAAPGSLHFQGGDVTQIPTNNQGANQDGGDGIPDPAYYWATGHAAGPLTIDSGVVSTTVDLTIASLSIPGDPEGSGTTHPQDDILSIAFSGLAPRQDYNVVFDDGITPPVPHTADPQGDMFLYYVVRPGILKEDGQPYEPGQPATPVDIELYDRNRGSNPNMIVGRTFRVFTPVDPYLNVPHGSQWPAGSAITIQGRQHTPGHFYDVKLEQGTTISDRVDNVPGGGVEAIAGSLNGEFNLDHIIPITYTPGFYYIHSYDCGPSPSPSDFSSCDYSDWVAEFPIRVTDQPMVFIENGERWPPGATITIQLRYHAPNSPYQLWLDPNDVYGQQMRLKDIEGRETFITNATGYAELTYHIPVTLTEQFEPTGYQLHSFYGVEDDLTAPVADNAHLEIVKSDLLVTQIELPDDPVVDTYLPIRVTVTNSSPVTITNHYFDTDLYIDPAAPPNLGSIVPPGEFKTWIDSIAGYGSVTFDEEIVLYGPQSHRLFARTDTSDRLVETDEANNMLEYAVPAACPYEVTDEFDDGVIGADWTTTTFGNSGQTCPIPADFPPVLEAPHTALELGWPPGSGTSAFNEVDDPFETSGVVDSRTDLGTSSGQMWVEIHGPQEGGIAVSSGAETTFTTYFDRVDVSFDYRMRQVSVESDEQIEYYLYIDGQPWNGGTGQLGSAFQGGGSQYSNWQGFSETLTLTPGEHTFTWGIAVRYIGSDSSRDAALNNSSDYAYGLIDNISIIDTVTPSPNLSNSGLPASPLEQYHFSSGYDGFSFARNTFRDTTSSSNSTVQYDYESSDGAWYDDVNSSDGAISMQLGRLSSSAYHVSGAFQQHFETTGTCVAIQGYYRVNFPHDSYDGGEQTQVLLAVDGDEPVILDSYNGGDSVRPDDSGWVPFTVSVALDPTIDQHLLEIGGYNNRSDGGGEVTEIWFDDLYIIDNGNGDDTSNLSESGGVLTLANAGADSLNIDDNAINPEPAGYTLLHRPVSSINGPFEVTVRLDNPPATADGEAGLELRDDASGTSAKLMFTYASSGKLQIYSRASNAYPVLQRQMTLGHSGSIWLRVSRNGNQFSFDYSTVNSETPPADWQTFDVVTFDLPDSLRAGLLNAPNIPAGQAAQPARFRHFHLCASDVLAGGTSGASQNFLGNRCGQVEEAGHGLVVIDAINYTIRQDGYRSVDGSGTGEWDTISDNDVLGEPTMTGLQADITGSDTPLPPSVVVAGVTTRPPHLQYEVNFETGGTYYVWVAGRGGSDSDRDSVHVGLNETFVGTVDGFFNNPNNGKSVTWVQMPGSVDIDAGSLNTIHLWASHDDVRVFKIMLTQNPDFIPPPDGMSQSACSIIVPPPIPPHLQQCLNPIQRGDFEGTFAEVTSVWNAQGNGLVYGTTSQSGNRGAAFPAFPPFQPAIYQDFQLPTWMLEDTEALLKFNKAVDWRGLVNGDPGNQNPDDVLYLTLRRQEFNDLDGDGRVEDNEFSFGFDLIEPVTLTHGAESPDIDPNVNPPSAWTTFNQNIFEGLNPLSFVEPGDRVRAFIYARKSDGSAPEDTAFYLDNISLNFCTTQPEPEIVSGTGRLSGRTLRFGQPVVGAEIWAYATAESDDYEPGPVFKTYSIQDGSYSFYNLPPGQYLIYATITDPNGTFFDSALRNVNPGESVTNVILTIETS